MIVSYNYYSEELQNKSWKVGRPKKKKKFYLSKDKSVQVIKKEVLFRLDSGTDKGPSPPYNENYVLE